MSRAAIELAQAIGLDISNATAFTIRARLDGVTVTIQKILTRAQVPSTQRFLLTALTDRDQDAQQPPASARPEGGQK